MEISADERHNTAGCNAPSIDFPEENMVPEIVFPIPPPTEYADPPKNKSNAIMKKGIIFIVIGLLLINSVLNVSNMTVKKPTFEVVKMDTSKENLNPIMQQGPAVSYIDNRTRVLTIHCKPTNTMKQFSLGMDFDLENCH